MKIDFKIGIVTFKSVPFLNKGGNIQYKTVINKNGEITEHHVIRIIYK